MQIKIGGKTLFFRFTYEFFSKLFYKLRKL